MTTRMMVIINSIQFIIHPDSDLDFQRITPKKGDGDCTKTKGDDDRPEINRDNVQNIFRVTSEAGEKQLKELVERLGVESCWISSSWERAHIPSQAALLSR